MTVIPKTAGRSSRCSLPSRPEARPQDSPTYGATTSESDSRALLSSQRWTNVTLGSRTCPSILRRSLVNVESPATRCSPGLPRTTTGRAFRRLERVAGGPAVGSGPEFASLGGRELEFPAIFVANRSLTLRRSGWIRSTGMPDGTATPLPFETEFAGQSLERETAAEANRPLPERPGTQRLAAESFRRGRAHPALD